MERYFDAHLYFASWATHRSILRTRSHVAGKHLILDLHSEDEGAADYEGSEGSLAALAPLRAELKLLAANHDEVWTKVETPGPIKERARSRRSDPE